MRARRRQGSLRAGKMGLVQQSSSRILPEATNYSIMITCRKRRANCRKTRPKRTNAPELSRRAEARLARRSTVGFSELIGRRRRPVNGAKLGGDRTAVCGRPIDTHHRATASGAAIMIPGGPLLRRWMRWLGACRTRPRLQVLGSLWICVGSVKQMRSIPGWEWGTDKEYAAVPVRREGRAPSRADKEQGRWFRGGIEVPPGPAICYFDGR